MNWRWKIAQNAEIRWWQRYLKNRPVASYLQWKTDYWQSFLKKNNIHFSGKEKILDAGCGPAGVFMVLDSHQVDAVDPLLPAYETSIEHFRKEDYPNVSFFPVAFEAFETEIKYDTIFCLNALNHFEEIDASVDKLFDLLKENGRMYVSIDAHNFSFFKKIFQFIPGDILHPHQYDLEDYKKMFTSRGGKIIATNLIKKEFLFDYYLLTVE